MPLVLVKRKSRETIVAGSVITTTRGERYIVEGWARERVYVRPHTTYPTKPVYMEFHPSAFKCEVVSRPE